VYHVGVATHIRKNITVPAELDRQLRRLARERGASQSGLIVQLVTLGLATQESGEDPLLRYVGSISGPPDLSETVDQTVYRR
jgi:hypothetical protein